jgi:hypothetical protein
VCVCGGGGDCVFAAPHVGLGGRVGYHICMRCSGEGTRPRVGCRHPQHTFVGDGLAFSARPAEAFQGHHSLPALHPAYTQTSFPPSLPTAVTTAAAAAAAATAPQMRETALIRAAHNGHLAVVEHLLQSGADIGARDLVRNHSGGVGGVWGEVAPCPHCGMGCGVGEEMRS